MRPLNRPMFKYGGPIKEGIMHGMQDGGLANNEGPRRAALVGNPIYDQTKGPDGRTKHILPFLIGAGGMAARVLAPRAIMGGLRSAISGFKGARYVSPFDKGITKTQRFRNLFPTQRFRQGQVPSQGNVLTDAQIKAGMIPKMGQRSILETLKDPRAYGAAIRENPLLAFGVAGQIKNAPEIAKGIFDVGVGAGQGAINYLLGTEFGKDKLPEGGKESELKRVDEIGTGEGTTGGSVVDDPKKKKEIDDARIEKTKKRYYELMGIDKMKKDAVYDSLIDASKIVQEQGGDLKGAIRSGALQTQIINAISKNLDKSADIKRQIDAAILKGEITKDVAAADTTDKEYKKARTKQLKQATSATGQIAAIEAEKGTILGSQTAAILRASDIKYDDIIQDKLFNNFVKDNPGADEIDFMQAKGTGLDDGRYVIRGRLVEKKGNEVAFIV